MQIIKREELPEQRQVRLTIAVDKDTWQASLAKCYQGVKSVCPVAGEPTRENLEQAYGPEFLYQEAVNDTYPQALVEAISQSDIQIAGTPHPVGGDHRPRRLHLRRRYRSVPGGGAGPVQGPVRRLSPGRAEQ